jgi:hypothetical protein
MDDTIQNTIAIAVEHIQGEYPDPFMAKTALKEIARKLKIIAGTAKGQPIAFQPTNGEEARHRFWAIVEPTIEGYSKALDFLLQNIPSTLANTLADKFAPKKVRFYDIQWDTDGETVEDLPTEVTLEVPGTLDIEMEGADLLSDKYGWCIHGFQHETN